MPTACALFCTCLFACDLRIRGMSCITSKSATLPCVSKLTLIHCAADGYAKRFGIVYVDYRTQQRLVKKSARWLQSFFAQS